MKNIFVTIFILISMYAMGSENQIIVLASGLNCSENGNFNIQNPETNIHFILVDDQYDSRIFSKINLIGNSPCTLDLLEQIREEATGTFGYLPGKVILEQLPNNSIQVNVHLFSGASHIELTGVTTLSN